MVAKRVLFVTPSPRKRARRTTPRVRVARKMVRRTIKRRRSRSNGKRRVAPRLKAGLSKFEGTTSKNVTILDRPTEAITSRTWSAVNLCSIPFDAANTHNARSGELAHITGFHHAVNFLNQRDVPVKVYQYWIIPNQYREDMTDADLQNDFYTIHGEKRDTDVNWTNNRPSYLYDEPVNSNKFTVLKKKVITLAPFALTGGGNSGKGEWPGMKTYHTSKTFIRLNRKFTYGTAPYEEQLGEVSVMKGDADETGDSPIQAPVFWIMFAVPIMEVTGATIIPNCIRRESHIITFFRDEASGL